MAHENEYITASASKRHRQTRGQMSLKDKRKEEEEKKYRDSMAYAASYMEKIRNKRAARSSSTPISTLSDSDSSSIIADPPSEIKSKTLKTMLLSSSNAGDLSNAGQPARLATSRRGGIRPGGRSFRPSNASSLADLANKNTISKDNTTGDEEREARLLANMGKKICNTSQQAKRFEASHGEWRKRRRRAPKGLSEALDKDLTQPDANQLDKLDQSLSSIKATARPAEVDPFDFWDATKKHKPKRGEIPEAESLR